MKPLKSFLLITLLLMPIVLLAQSETSPPLQIPYLNFIIAFASASLAALAVNALKYIGSPKWNTREFLITIVVPWILSILGGVALISIEYFAPFLKDYFYIIDFNDEIKLDYVNLFSLGFTFSIIIKKIYSKIFGKK
jgi:hypothetical protein